MKCLLELVVFGGNLQEESKGIELSFQIDPCSVIQFSKYLVVIPIGHLFDPLNFAEGVPVRTHSLYYRGLASLGQVENLSLERATTEGRLETAFLVIFPNEFGEIGPNLNVYVKC